MAEELLVAYRLESHPRKKTPKSNRVNLSGRSVWVALCQRLIVK